MGDDAFLPGPEPSHDQVVVLAHQNTADLLRNQNLYDFVEWRGRLHADRLGRIEVAHGMIDVGYALPELMIVWVFLFQIGDQRSEIRD